MTSIKNFHTDIKNKSNVVGAMLGYHKGIVGNGIGYIALVEKKFPVAELPSRADQVPPFYFGAHVGVLEVGKLWAQRTDRIRPAPGGVSVGHYAITAGTLGMIVRDSDGNWYILSNNHVLAASNSGEIGDPILQPGSYDGGTNDDQIGTLANYVEIAFGDAPPPVPPDCGSADLYTNIGNALARLVGSGVRVQAYRPVPQAVNLVDAAIAAVSPSDVDPNILEIGAITKVVDPELGMAVRKSGRTTGLTTGAIIGIDATVTVGYGGDLSATFDGQIITSGMSQGGDSGSVLVDANSQNAVGLLFAGSEQITIHGKMSTVMDLLEVTPV